MDESVVEKPLLINIDENIKSEFEIIVKREKSTNKKLLTQIIKDYVQAHKEGNDQHLMTSYLDNEDFIGFPSVALNLDKKKAYIEKNLIKDGKLTELGTKLFYHTQEWFNILGKK